MQRELVFATNNLHKLSEVRAMLAPHFTVKSLDELGCTEDIAETGATFEENAAIKSLFIYKAFRIDCFADDSGLEIEALGNEPGVYSARYAGTRDTQDNIDLVLLKMTGITNRKACFRTVISLIIDGREHLFEGAAAGTIRHERSGATGFGYDPIFQPDGFEETFAEMAADEKNRISHRGIAIRKMVDFLLAMPGN